MSTSGEGEISVTQKISLKRVQDLLCCAFEGGSNYWCRLRSMGMSDTLNEIFGHWDQKVYGGA